jgi:adenylate cyclase
MQSQRNYEFATHSGAKATYSVSAAAGYATLGQIGFEHRREYTAIGSVINLASRLCDEARPGQVIISQRQDCIKEEL